MLFISEQLEGIYEFLNHYTLRSISYDGFNETVARRIQMLRPMPTSFNVIAGTNSIQEIMPKVATLEGVPTSDIESDVFCRPPSGMPFDGQTDGI